MLYVASIENCHENQKLQIYIRKVTKAFYTEWLPIWVNKHITEKISIHEMQIFIQYISTLRDI